MATASVPFDDEAQRVLSHEVRETVAHVLGLDIGEVHLKADLRDDLGVDLSTGALTLLALEEAFEVDLDDEFDSEAFRTVSDIVARVTTAVARFA